MTAKTQMHHKERVRQYIAAFDGDDLDTLRTISTIEMFGKTMETRNFVRATFSDHSIQIQEMIAEDQTVVVRVLSTGRHTGDFMGVPATDREWQDNEGVGFFRFADEKIMDVWWIFNIPMHLRKLGITMTLSA